MRRVGVLLLVLSVSAPAPAQPPAPAGQAPGSPDAPAAIDPTKLGVSLSRIEKGLAIDVERDLRPGNPLRIEYQVQVFGQAPRIDVIGDFNLLHGTVPGAAPSHREMIDFWTPKAFAAPSMPLLSMAYWAARYLYKKSQKTACEEEIARYRALLMQGVNVSAPRCTQ